MAATTERSRSSTSSGVASLFADRSLPSLFADRSLPSLFAGRALPSRYG
jgi:hypothetical protein